MCDQLSCVLLAIPGGNDQQNDLDVSGGYTYNTILRYDAIKDVWIFAGQMRDKRQGHAVAVVDRDIVKHRCY